MSLTPSDKNTLIGLVAGTERALTFPEIKTTPAFAVLRCVPVATLAAFMLATIKAMQLIDVEQQIAAATTQQGYDDGIV